MNPEPRPALSPSVWLLGWVSFFTDMASEMIYPLLPLFLTQVLGAGAMSLGVVEGAAEAANSALKVMSGRWSDRARSRKRLVLVGYGIASAVRPMIAAATVWPQVLAIRFTDRVGKGIRGAPRDAMLADLAPIESRGRVFGFHRAMDHAGAVTGPLLASAFLYFYPGQYRPLFALTLIPGLIVMLLILRLPETQPRAAASAGPGPEPRGSDALPEAGGAKPGVARRSDAVPDAGGAKSAWWQMGTPFYRAMAVIFLFSLGNASDAFLLLRLSDMGVAAVWIPLLWSALHVVKSSSSVIGGALSDRFGRRGLIALGWIVYACVYAAFGVADSVPVAIAVFLAYGLFFGLTEGTEKAWVADMAPVGLRGTAFGLYNAALGVGGLASSLLFGLLWTTVSPAAAFHTGAALALLASGLLFLPAFRGGHSSLR